MSEANGSKYMLYATTQIRAKVGALREHSPVAVKTHEQQQLQQLHGLRETWKKSRSQHINLLRGIFRE